MSVAKFGTLGTSDATRSDERNNSLDTFIRQAIGKEPLLSFSRTGDNPVQLIQLLHALDQPDGQNLLAVIVYPPDHPGRIPPEGGQGGDHEIAKDVAAQYVEGWDWMTPMK
nr:mannosylglycoprotein endo-beta-mannosidase [Ipomoea batatas]